MSHILSQIPLSLAAKEPFAKRYFVFHSGVAQAFSLFETHLRALAEKKASGVCYFVSGITGVGKSHFVNIARELAVESGIENILVYDNLTPELCREKDWCRRFVGDYQLALQTSGILLAASSYCPQELCLDESVRSRLVAAERLELMNPLEEELLPILQSIAERRNLQLSERNVDYIIRRIPRNPLSFENMFDTIDELCLTSGKPAGLQMIRSVLAKES